MISKEKNQRRYSKRDVRQSAIQGRNIQNLVFTSSLFRVPVDVDISNKNLFNVSAIKFTAHGTGILPNAQEMLLEDNATFQRLRLRFLNWPTQWQVDLTDTCTPVKEKEIDPKYDAKYDLMDLSEDRFEVKYPATEETQEEYRDQPISHFPSMGFKEEMLKEHLEAMKKRPWKPMKTMPKRLETMGQYPYPPVESPLIGRNEPKENMYQLLAHAYNTVQERCDNYEKRIRKLEAELDAMHKQIFVPEPKEPKGGVI